MRDVARTAQPAERLVADHGRPSANVTIFAVHRFALALIVAFLSLSASGLSGLVLVEPCAAYEQTNQDDGACPPTCVTCGCCAQAVETVAIAVANRPDVPSPDLVAIVPVLLESQARDVLHVPKLRS